MIFDRSQRLTHLPSGFRQRRPAVFADAVPPDFAFLEEIADRFEAERIALLAEAPAPDSTSSRASAGGD